MGAVKGDSRDDTGLDIELAYRDLPASAARVLRLLPVHPGLDAPIAAVAALADLTLDEARSALRSLDLACLVQAVPGYGNRWRIRHHVRAYAGRLSAVHAVTDEREQARDRLLYYYQTAAEAADGQLQGRPPIPVPQEFDDRDGALAWLDAERANLIAVTRAAADEGRDYAAKSLPLLMAHYLDSRGFFDDFLAVTTIGLDAARRLGDRVGEGEALNNLGDALISLERYDAALARYQDAIEIFRRVGNRRAEAESSANLAVALTGLGRYDQALTTYQDALAVLRLTGDQRAEGAALNNLGVTLRALRRYDEARAAYEKAVAIFRETGDQDGLAMALGNLGKLTSLPLGGRRPGLWLPLVRRRLIGRGRKILEAVHLVIPQFAAEQLRQQRIARAFSR